MTATTTGNSAPFTSLPKASAIRIRPFVVAVLIAKIVLLFILAWNSRFVMDEFVQFGWAKYLPHELFKTIWPGKAVGYAVFYKIDHLIGWDARSILLAGRLQTALVACGTIAIVYATARRLGRSSFQALLTIAVLLSFSNFIERIFRTIAEPLAVFFAAAALLVAVRGERSAPRIVAAGVLCGLSFLTTQKALYFDVALGLGLVGDALLARRYRDVIPRGAWLVAGWLIAVAAYCLAFGGLNPRPIAEHLFFGPAAVLSPQVAAAYGGLRNYVVQTLVLNPLLYLLCFSGMIAALSEIRRVGEPKRIALIFSTVITVLVFKHDQPWPYVFVMCLPFLALWVVEPFEILKARPALRNALGIVLAMGIAMSFLRNFAYLQIHNRDQLALVDRAESLLGPGDVYFDGVGMLPNRSEPSTLWLDRTLVLQTLRERQASEAYRIFDEDPPKLILWNYRLDAVAPVVMPLIGQSYVKIAPNLRIAGRVLRKDVPAAFDVPVTGVYRLYGRQGQPLAGRVRVDGAPFDGALKLNRGLVTITLVKGADEALLLPEGAYAGHIATGPDNEDLFARVYS